MTLAQSHSQEIMLIHVEDYISLEKKTERKEISAVRQRRAQMTAARYAAPSN